LGSFNFQESRTCSTALFAILRASATNLSLENAGPNKCSVSGPRDFNKLFILGLPLIHQYPLQSIIIHLDHRKSLPQKIYVENIPSGQRNRSSDQNRLVVSSSSPSGAMSKSSIIISISFPNVIVLSIVLQSTSKTKDNSSRHSQE
jgi:hypothetical protein